MKKTRTTMERLLNLCTPEPNTGCWIWIGCQNSKGYGKFNYVDETLAHRASWLLHGKEIPKGKYLRHNCKVKTCINPSHMSIVNDS